MLLRNRSYRLEVEWIAQRMSNHDRARAGRNGSFNERSIDIVGRNINIDKNRHKSVLNAGVDCRWKTSSDRYHFIARLDGSLA
jgi:hypothetical protein